MRFIIVLRFDTKAWTLCRQVRDVMLSSQSWLTSKTGYIRWWLGSFLFHPSKLQFEHRVHSLCSILLPLQVSIPVPPIYAVSKVISIISLDICVCFFLYPSRCFLLRSLSLPFPFRTMERHREVCSPLGFPPRHVEGQGAVEMFERISHLCTVPPANGMDLVDNWQTFWGRPGLIRRRHSAHIGWWSSHLYLIWLSFKFIFVQKHCQPRLEARRQSRKSLTLLCASIRTMFCQSSHCGPVRSPTP